jgi:hypothetical protein
LFGGRLLGTGLGVVVGIAARLQAGACLAVQAAKDREIISSEQIGELSRCVCLTTSTAPPTVEVPSPPWSR